MRRKADIGNDSPLAGFSVNGLGIEKNTFSSVFCLVTPGTGPMPDTVRTQSDDPNDQADKKRCVGDCQGDNTVFDFVLWLFVRHGWVSVGECGFTIAGQALTGPEGRWNVW